MLLLDERIGSKELLPFFRPYDITVSLTHLDFGDACFCGNGPDGPELIGYERKTLHDMLSSMRSKRLSGYQLPGLLAAYTRVGLILEGVWRCGERGVAELLIYRTWRTLLVGSQPIMYRELDHYLATLENICGVTVHMTSNPMQTVALLVSRYKWWNDKTWAQHQSHEQIYAPALEGATRRRGTFTRRHVGLVEKVAAQLPGIDRKAWNVGKKFKSVREMGNAEVGQWMKVKGVGKKGAEVIVRAIRGG